MSIYNITPQEMLDHLAEMEARFENRAPQDMISDANKWESKEAFEQMVSRSKWVFWPLGCEPFEDVSFQIPDESAQKATITVKFK